MFTSKLKRCIFIVLLVISFTLISGCGEEEVVIGKPGPEDFLDAPEVDIFLWEDVVFLNAHNNTWVNEKEYSLGNSIGEITKTTTNAKEFSNGTSSKLPIGTKIYLAEGYEPIVEGYESTEILIVVNDGVQIPYLAQIPRIIE